MAKGLALLDVVVFVSALAACAHAPTPCDKPEPIRIIIKAGASLNLGEDGQSLPTVVRVYLLKSDQAISGASAEDLQRSDKDTLGGDLIDAKEITLKPASYEKVGFERTPASTTIAVVALVRNPESDSWRVVSHLPPEDAGHCHHGKPGETGPEFDFLVVGNRIRAGR